MKKQIKKLSLNKKIITNLTSEETIKKVGGNAARTNTCFLCTWTCHGRTCNRPCGY